MISLPHDIVASTLADATQVQANFDELELKALDKTGDTATGTINTQVLLPRTDATYDLGSASFRYKDLYLSGSITGPGAVNSFGTIAVSGQSNVVADATNDTLTLAAGQGITITTTAGSDTVTIASTQATVGAINVGQGGVIYDSQTSAGNAGTGEDTLASQAIAANVLATNGDSIAFRAFGSYNNNTNNKRIRVKYGSTTILDTGNQDSTTSSWVITGTITRTGAASQLVEANWITSLSALTGAGVTTAGETLSGAVTLSITGEATDNDDIVFKGWKIFWWPNAPQ